MNELHVSSRNHTSKIYNSLTVKYLDGKTKPNSFASHIENKSKSSNAFKSFVSSSDNNKTKEDISPKATIKSLKNNFSPTKNNTITITLNNKTQSFCKITKNRVLPNAINIPFMPNYVAKIPVIKKAEQLQTSQEKQINYKVANCKDTFRGTYKKAAIMDNVNKSVNALSPSTRRILDIYPNNSKVLKDIRRDLASFKSVNNFLSPRRISENISESINSITSITTASQAKINNLKSSLFEIDKVITFFNG